MITSLLNLRCDSCTHSVIDEFGTEEHARELMATYGWIVHQESCGDKQRDQDRCPDCAVKAGEFRLVIADPKHWRQWHCYRCSADGVTWTDCVYKDKTFWVMDMRGRTDQIIPPEQRKYVVHKNKYQ